MEGWPQMEIVKDVRPPSGLGKALFRLPLHLYRARLGFLFGRRILVLNHVGRVTGKPRQAVLEVIVREPDGSYVVASGWGTTAAWYRNVLQSPEVSIMVGTRTIPVTGVPVPTEEGADIMAQYATEHRAAAKFLLPRLMGYQVDGSLADFRAVGRHLPFLRFVPR